MTHMTDQERSVFEAWAASIGLCVTGKYAETIDVLCAESAFKAGYQAGRAAPQSQPQETIAYVTRNEEGDPAMLFFDLNEARLYCNPDEEPEALVLAGSALQAQDQKDAARYRWLRTRWGRIADEYDGDGDQLVAIREADSHFEGWDVDPLSLDRAIDAAIAAQAKQGGCSVNKVTCEQVVRMLKEIGVSTTAKHVAECMGTSSRAVATALRAATEDKRVSFRYKKGICWYRFVRFTPRATQAAKQGEHQK